jgi:hypothetical protein
MNMVNLPPEDKEERVILWIPKMLKELGVIEIALGCIN